MKLFKRKQEKQPQLEVDFSKMKKFRVTTENKNVYEIEALDKQSAINALVYPICDPKVRITDIDKDSHQSLKVEEVVEG